MDTTKPAPLDLFISYSEEDEKFKKELETHLAPLRREGTIRPWHSQQTQAGLEPGKEIDAHFNQSQIIQEIRDVCKSLRNSQARS